MKNPTAPSHRAILPRLEQLASANRHLKREIIEKQKAESALKKSEAHYVQLFEQSRHMQEQLRHLSRQLILAQEEERKRISRELHDEIVQTLVGINVHLASLKVKARLNIKDLMKKIGQTQRLVEKSVNTVHRFARELRPTVLDDLGLIPALQAFIKDFSKRTSLRVRFVAFSGVEQLNSTKRTVIYRVVQSALSNVDRHAHASEVRVSIRKLQSVVRLEIHDNGKSFEIERVLFAKRHRRLGLLGSRERVEMVGGRFGIESAPRKEPSSARRFRSRMADLEGWPKPTERLITDRSRRPNRAGVARRSLVRRLLGTEEANYRVRRGRISIGLDFSSANQPG
jgi:signal transduction histidine kinase